MALKAVTTLHQEGADICHLNLSSVRLFLAKFAATPTTGWSLYL